MRGTCGEARGSTLLVGAPAAETRRRLVAALDDPAFELVLATDGSDLLASLEVSRPDAVLLAFDGMQANDFTLCRELRRQRGGETLPILVIASGEAPELLEAACAAGATDLLPEAAAPAVIRHRVRQLLRAAELDVRLRGSEASLEHIQRIAQIGSWELVPRTRQMRWSERTFAILGLEPGTTQPDFESFSLCFHPEDRRAVGESIFETARSGRPFSVPHRIVLANGGVRHVHQRGEVVRADGREPFVRGTLQDVTSQRRAQEKIRHLAHFDSLTGLSNRRRFKEKLEESIRSARCEGHPLALLYMDLDQFKRINDTLGHTAGDRLLQGVADILVEHVRREDVVVRDCETLEAEISRVGGDEFAVLLSRISCPEDAGQVADRILSALPTPISFETTQILTTASIGIAVFPTDGDDAETLVKHADTAMYHAKERGRNNYQFFSRAMNAAPVRRLALETQLRGAAARGELRVLYQPRLDLRTRRVESVEALLRWNHPELGSVSPKEFIPVAEETGMILPIGEWVLRTACAQARAWAASGYGDVRVSVNVSTQQFRTKDLVASVASALRDAGIQPRQLELEITESAMLQNDDRTARALRDLHAMGVLIALDDFGTGYSSLGYLTRVPLDTLKIDRSLVCEVFTDPSARGIATAVIAMAHALGLRVVAEGVDADEQAEILSEQGCDELQGFLVAGALPPEECEGFFARAYAVGERRTQMG